jgi:hypothetical protein
MNPLALLLPAGLIVWYLTKGSDKPKAAASSPGAPLTGPSGIGANATEKATESFVARSEDYTDRNGVVWILSNPFPTVWQGRVKNDPKGYPGYERAWDETLAALWQPKGSSRAEVVNMIDGLLALGTKADIQPDIDAGTKAGLDDANASIQAYKDSWTGYQVKPVYVRWDASKNKAWQDAYNKEFERQLCRFNYDVKNKFVVKGHDAPCA